MAFDECAPILYPGILLENSVARTVRWLERCKAEMARLNSLPDTVNPHQLLFGINQGGTFEDIRIAHADTISAMDCDAMPSAAWQWGRAMRRCTASWM